MEEIISILMRRDGISKGAAAALCDQVQQEIDEVLGRSGSYDEVEDILMYNLGLEPDYIMNFL